ncbi:MAG: T9SS type A sorting domain-containing protein [Ignavibacteria bacterium]
MKKLSFNIILLIITGVFLIYPVKDQYAKERKGYNPVRMNAGNTNNFLQVNNINTIFRSDGYFNYDKVNFANGDAGMIWPVSSPQRLTAIFTTGIFVGAKINGELRTAASMYNTHFSPGNIPTVGSIPGSSVCSDPRIKNYQVNLTDPSLINGGQRIKNAAGRDYTIQYDSWASWPVDLGAPYVEVNGIPGYQPEFDGDRPGVGNSAARPDEIIWCVFMDYTNCTNNQHVAEISLPGGTPPMGLEVQQTSFAFLAPGLLNMYFVKWKMINKSNDVWDSTYTAVACDPDLGDANDDAVGCDSVSNIAFCYNFGNNDAKYGAAPPAVGYKYLQSPIVFTGNPADTAKLPYGNLIGYRALGLSSFNYFANLSGNQCLGDPDAAINAYNFMTGKDGCGNPLVNWVTGNPTKYKWSGDACNKTGWYDSVQGDKRFLQCSGPFVMNSQDTQIICIGSFIERGSSNNLSVCALLDAGERVQQFYNSNFAATPLPPAPQVNVVANGDGNISLYWGTRSESYDVYDSLGRTGRWRFQGYNVYQVKPGTSGDKETERVLLATYDVVDSILTVYDTLNVIQPNGTTQPEYKPVAFGTNTGVARVLSMTVNKYPVGDNNFFINGTTYKFAVTAYGVNLLAGRPFKVLENPVSAQVINVIPNFPIMGTNFINKQFDTLSISKPDKVFIPVVIDPLRVVSANYRMVFTSDTTWDVYRIQNAQIDTILRRNVSLSLANINVQIGDGILFRADKIPGTMYGVIKDPSPTSKSVNKGWNYTGGTVNLGGADTTALKTALTTGYKPPQSLSMGLSWPSGANFRAGYTSKIDSVVFLHTSALKRVKITFGQTQKAYRYRGTLLFSPYQDYVDVPFKVELDDPQDTNSTVPRQLNVAFYDGDSSGTWNPKNTPDGGFEFVYIMYSTYDPNPNTFYTTKNVQLVAQFRNMDVMYVWQPRLLTSGPAYSNGDVLEIVPYTRLQYQQSPGTVTVIETGNTTAPTIGSTELASSRGELSTVRVVPNPYYGGQSQESSPFDRFVKFMNMPKTATIYIYSLNGNLVRQINKDDNNTSINWDLLNTDRIPIASGIYIAYIDAPGIGTKTIKLAIFTPEERIDSF